MFEEALQPDQAWHAVVLGEPGQGKSALINMLSRKLAVIALEALRDPRPGQRHVPLPIPVQLDDLAAISRNAGEPGDIALRRSLPDIVGTKKGGLGDYLKNVDFLPESTASCRPWYLLDGGTGAYRPSELRWVFERA